MWNKYFYLNFRSEFSTYLIIITIILTEIVAYIERIAANGLAYATPDGVYFDTAALGSAYGRLAPPEAQGDGPVARVGAAARESTGAGEGKGTGEWTTTVHHVILFFCITEYFTNLMII